MYQWDFASLWDYRGLIAGGVLTTLLYTVIVILTGLPVGVLAGLGQLSSHRLLAVALRAYVEVFRCTPVLVQLVWFYYALPVVLGIELAPGTAAVLCLTLYGGAFYAEIVRAGVMSIDAGQRAAGLALGMTPGQVMRGVVLPQAVRRMVPPLVSQSILQFKNTSLLSVLAIPDLLYQGQAIAHDTYRPMEVYTLIAVVYVLLLLPATLYARRLEARTTRALAGD